MKAEAKSFKFLTLEGKVIIPFFQRTYVWGQENWEELLNEFSSEDSNHFLGTIILKQLPVCAGEPKALEVIDGQQRLTTLSVLLKALYDSFPDEIKNNAEADIKSILFYKRDYASDALNIKIEHSRVDSDAYRKVIDFSSNKELLLSEISENSHRILQCYKYFSQELFNWDVNQKRSLLNKILSPENKMLVVIDIDETDDEQAIFDTLNTAGVRLSTSEIIKNAIFKKLIQLGMKKTEVIDLYTKTWEKTFQADEETIKYWETERKTGRLKRDNIEILLHSYAVIKNFFDPDKHHISDVSKLYKQEIRDNNLEDMKFFINDIIEYANIYREYFPEFDTSTLYDFGDSISRLFHILDQLELSTFHPFILYVLKEYKNDKQTMGKLLFNLEKFVVRRMIAKETTRNYNKYCRDFIKDPSSIEEKIKETDDEKISDGLRNISNSNASLLLFWVELYRRFKDPKCELKELKYTYSLEHIMPQAWEIHWNEFPKRSHPDGTPWSEENLKADRQRKIYWIGNMTLLRSSLNSAIRNHKFEVKINGEGKKKGIRHYADLFITKEDILFPYDNGDKTWDEDKIEARTKKLEKEVREIWGDGTQPNK